MSNYNPGFAFYDKYYMAIEHLPLEQQKEICYAFIKYGITGEIVSSEDMPLGNAFVIANQLAIDNSVDRWLKNIQKANDKIDNVVSRDMAIAELIAEGMNSKQIADEISLKFGKISDSAIRKSNPWKDKNKEDFSVKWLVKNSQQNSQAGCENSQKECENSREFTGKERENSQKNVNFPEF